MEPLETGFALDKPGDSGDSHTKGAENCVFNESNIKSWQADATSEPGDSGDSRTIGEKNCNPNELNPKSQQADAASGSQRGASRKMETRGRKRNHKKGGKKNN